MGSRALSLAVLAMLPSPAAAAGCEVAKMLEIPVTMSGQRPMVTATFGDRPARFILDSGAFYSTMSRATAAEFGLDVEPLPSNFRLKGIGGDASAGSAVAKNFSLGGVVLPKVSFVVGGSDTGTAGLLGQNILGLADVEYDLPHGAVRLMKTSNCGKTLLAYWAGERPVTAVPLERPEPGPFKPHTIGTVLLNGKRIRAVFDTGAQRSLLSLAAAKRLGVTPTSPGVVPAGMGSGLGSRQVASWIAPFEQIDIGGEAINRPRIHIADVAFGNADMLIGVDFFLTHRIFVSNATRTMYVTYEGGPMFGLSPRGARTAEGTALDLTDKTGEPTDAEGYSRRGAVLASNNKLAEALADLDKAVAMAPGEGRYLHQRAMMRLANRQLLPALGDLDRTIALLPNDADARVVRAGLRLGGGDLDGAKADLKAADAALAPSSNQRLTLGGLYDRVEMPEAALANYTAWLRDHPEDSKRATALNGRCWARAQLNRELDQALSDCNAALRAMPGRASYLDSRALVRLRRGEFDAALADYDAALRANPRSAWSLYARGLAAGRASRTAEAAANRAAALAIDPRIGDRARRIGLDK
ncbi:aspartyl protease family protein [Sphingomonas rubra]|uniref:Tetratricopeptide repeat-containing protein n=1 Tax=Sphingomonas rubra TaxID=634430 RepID=A0A1I5TLS5_9SPHN|nr:aspartyl protease family protein [Sphingomonas rubra]SFP83567.1 Tetratricopeptide repeat-containing protein [Sphingomonas rubra]